MGYEALRFVAHAFIVTNYFLFREVYTSYNGKEAKYGFFVQAGSKADSDLYRIDGPDSGFTAVGRICTVWYDDRLTTQ